MLLFLIHHSGFNIPPASTAPRIKQIFKLNVENGTNFYSSHVIA